MFYIYLSILARSLLHKSYFGEQLNQVELRRKYCNYLYSIVLGRNCEYVVNVIFIFLITQIEKAFSCVQEKSTDESFELIRPQFFEGLIQH